MLTRDDILRANDLPREEVPVPEWGGSVLVRTISGTERDAFEEAIMGRGRKIDPTNIRAKLCALCICDTENKRLFSDGDVAALGAKSASALDRVFETASKLNRIGAREVETLAKNSSSEESGNSISDSQPPSE